MKKYRDTSDGAINDLMQKTDERYLGNPKLRTRYAFEWFVRNQDLFYLRWALREIQEVADTGKRARRRITVVAVGSVVIALAALMISIFGLP